MRNRMANRRPFRGYPTKSEAKEKQRKEKQDELGVCRIRRNEGEQSSQTLGCGFVVKDLQILPGLMCLPYCLISSDKVFPKNDIGNYYLDFTKFESTVLKTINLADVVDSKSNAAIHRTSGLVVIPINPSEKYSKKDSIFNYRAFNVANERNKPDSGLRCHYVDDTGKEFAVKWLKMKQSDGQGMYELHDAFETYKTYAEVTARKGDPKPYGAVILKRSNDGFLVAGVLTFTDDERKKILPVFFPLPQLVPQGEAIAAIEGDPAVVYTEQSNTVEYQQSPPTDSRESDSSEQPNNKAVDSSVTSPTADGIQNGGREISHQSRNERHDDHEQTPGKGKISNHQHLRMEERREPERVDGATPNGGRSEEINGQEGIKKCVEHTEESEEVQSLEPKIQHIETETIVHEENMGVITACLATQQLHLVDKNLSKGASGFDQVDNPRVPPNNSSSKDQLTHTRLSFNVKDIPYAVYGKICLKLNKEDDMFYRDFRMLGEKMDYNKDVTDNLKQKPNPTDKLLQMWSVKPEATVRNLIALLKDSELERMDVAKVLEDWVERKGST